MFDEIASFSPQSQQRISRIRGESKLGSEGFESWGEVLPLARRAPPIRGVYVVIDSIKHPKAIDIDQIVYVGSSTAERTGIQNRLTQFANATLNGPSGSTRNSAGWKFHNRLMADESRDPWYALHYDLWFAYLDMDKEPPWNILAKEHEIIALVMNNSKSPNLLNTIGADWS
jgi:hypothetical protein